MKRILLPLGLLAAAIVVMIFVLPLSVRQKQEPDRFARILFAASTYAAELKAQGLPVPASVSLKDLISRKLMTKAEAGAFAGLEVTVNLAVDESRPGEVLVRAVMPDGRELLALTDGSVQQVRKGTRAPAGPQHGSNAPSASRHGTNVSARPVGSLEPGIYAARPYSGTVMVPRPVDNDSLRVPARTNQFAIRSMEPALQLDAISRTNRSLVQ